MRNHEQKIRPRAITALVILLTVIMPGCRLDSPPQLVLYHFENENELDNISWNCRTFYARDKSFATEGNFSLKVEMYPSSYPGFKSGKMEHNWSQYRCLNMDIHYPGPEPLRLAYRIDDRHDNPDYDDRVNGSFTLLPGANPVTLDLAELRTSGTRRPLILSHIDKFCIFLGHPEQPVTFFLDNIRLEK
ncbi:MAG: hypothetical protein J7L69_07645 [Desulfobulbaceae bacterium]|nr:hypothetical protein [Desulfobulbaceae bacterium]